MLIQQTIDQRQATIEASKVVLDEIDFELHEEAGLVYAGLDYFNETQWIGTKKQWNEYTKLKLKELNK